MSINLPEEEVPVTRAFDPNDVIGLAKDFTMDNGAVTCTLKLREGEVEGESEIMHLGVGLAEIEED